MRTTLAPLFACFALLAPSVKSSAQEPYRLPPSDVVAIADAPVPPSARFSPDGRWILFLQGDPLPTLADVSREMVKLAGMRIDPAANARHTTRFDRTISLRPLTRKDEVKIPIPDGARISGAGWSRDSRTFVFTLVRESGTELWCGTPEDPARPIRLVPRVNAVFGSGFTWLPDGESLLCWTVPEGRGEAPTPPKVPLGPNVQETSGQRSPVRTYQDLLSNPHDEACFDHYATAQLVRVDTRTGKGVKVGVPAIVSGASVSPDGRYLLVSRIHRPYSYLMPVNDFPEATEVWDWNGKVVHTVVDNGLAENIPIEGVRTGPRTVQWKAGEPATLLWVEALDGGDPKRKAEHRDRWMALAAPFDAKPRELFRLTHRARGVQFMRDPSKLIATEYDRDRKWVRTFLFDLTKADAPPVVLDDRSQQDRYNDPGSLLTDYDAAGFRVVRQEGPWVFRAGAGATPDGELPFLARQNLGTRVTERLWTCEAGTYESVVDLLPGGGDRPSFLTRFESPSVPPNYRLRGEGGTVTALTDEVDPTPQIRGISKQLVKYKRADGVDLSATLYLPAGYQKGTRLPLVVWAYPLEYTDPATAGQVSGSPSRFTRISGSSHLFYLTQGYAVMDNATMPIVGDPETMNDTFVEQIVASAKACIDKAVEMGVADPTRVGVGGHSYGAFMTANLLAHCDLFRAGCARSGAYNRTLTPFGFQSERRTLWEAPKTYVELSPFMVAHKINEPILLIHGEADSNTGTFPIQSERLFAAVKGNGGTARLVKLPKEDHGYAARESILHVLAEMIDWFDKYVKNAKPAPAEASGTR